MLRRVDPCQPINIIRQSKEGFLVARTYIAGHYLTFIRDETSERIADCMESRYAHLTGDSA